MAYQFQSRIRYSEVGEDRRLTLPGLVNYFQDCSIFQSEALEIGLEELTKRRRAWILASWQIEVERFPLLGEEVTTQTWLQNFTGFYGVRNFCMLDAQGRTLAQAVSIWIYMDIDRGRPSKVDADVREALKVEDRPTVAQLSRKIALEGEFEKREKFTVVRSHLDTNHHVNNGQYLVMAQEYLPQDFVIRRVRVEYKKSAKLHDVVVPFVSEREGVYMVSLCGEDEQPFAVIEFTGQFADGEKQAGPR